MERNDRTISFEDTLLGLEVIKIFCDGSQQISGDGSVNNTNARLRIINGNHTKTQ